MNKTLVWIGMALVAAIGGGMQTHLIPDGEWHKAAETLLLVLASLGFVAGKPLIGGDAVPPTGDK